MGVSLAFNVKFAGGELSNRTFSIRDFVHLDISEYHLGYLSN